MHPSSTKAWRPEPHDCAKQGDQTSNITTLQQKRWRDECAAIQAGKPKGWQGRGGSQQIELRSHPTQHLWTHKEARAKYLYIYIYVPTIAMTQTQWTNCIAVHTLWGRLPHIRVCIYPMHIHTTHYVYTYIQCVYLETQCIYIYIYMGVSVILDRYSIYLTDIHYIWQIFIISDRYSLYLTDIHYIWQIFIIFDRYSLYLTDTSLTNICWY